MKYSPLCFILGIASLACGPHTYSPNVKTPAAPATSSQPSKPVPVPDPHWGETVGGAQMRIAPVGDAFSVGQLMVIRVEVRNLGTAPLELDASGLEDISAVIRLRNSAGRTVPYMRDSSRQSGAHPLPVAPGRTAVVLELDLFEHFALTTPQKFTVQCVGGVDFSAPESGHAKQSLKSNLVAFEVLPGTLPSPHRFFDQIAAILPNGDWTAQMDSTPRVILSNRKTPASDALQITYDKDGTRFALHLWESSERHTAAQA